MSSFAGFIKDQYTTLPIIPTPQDCKGKTYIITGANTGLGYECAKHLVRLEAKRVILTARSPSKAEATKTKIEAETGITGVAEVWELELGSYDSVKRFAGKVKELDRLDAIIENASIALDTWTTSEGLETCLTVNVISTFLVALQVLPKLQDTAKRFGIETHLVVVGSGVAFEAKGEFEKIDGDILDGLNQGIMGKRYQMSKLLQFYVVRQLASLWPSSDTGVIINYLSPGLCRTELSRHVSFQMWMVIAIMRFFFARTAEMGSRILLYAAVAGKEAHGKYLSECEIREHYVPSWITDAGGSEMQERVWSSISRRLRVIEPGLQLDPTL